MSDRPAPSSAVPGPPTRQSILEGCMGALPQMFQWTRVLSSNHKCIATPHADARKPSAASEKQTRMKVAMLQHPNGGLRQSASEVINESAMGGSSMTWKAHVGHRETVGLDFRQVLHSKQEPFVLQDVIREKRQPVRTTSSRELKFEARPTRRSAKPKNSPALEDHVHAAGDGHSAACQIQYCVAPKARTASAADVQRNRVPVESMVAMPSHPAPALDGGHFATKAESKAASLGRNSVKSPNKRALLMEAAARILEGSNGRTFKRPWISIRSLSEELDKSKHVRQLSKPKEKLVRAVVLHSESSESEEELAKILVIPEDQRPAESKQHQHLGMHNRDNSCQKHFGTSQIVEGDLLVMQNRIFTYSNALEEAEVVPSLATPVQSPGSENMSECVQLHDNLCSGMKRIQKETMNQIVRGFKLNSYEAIFQAKLGANPKMLLKVITTEDQLLLAYDPRLKDSRAIMPSNSVDSCADFLPVMVMSSSLPNLDYRTPSLIRSFSASTLATHSTWGYHFAAPLPVVFPKNIEESSARTTRRSCIEGAEEAGNTHRLTDKFVEAEKSSAMQLRLCSYSWWAPCQNNSPKKQFSEEYCAGYGSPVAATCPTYLGKVWNEEMTEEGVSCYDVFPADEFQQASPVSVLEPLYEEELELDDSFNNFEEARHKLLEKVRRYEMLANMDVDVLKEVSEESYYHYSCSNSGGSDSSSQASPARELQSSDVKELAQSTEAVSYKHVMNEPYGFFADDQTSILYTNSGLIEELDFTRPIISSCTGNIVQSASPRAGMRVDTETKEVEGKVKYSLLGMKELMTMSDWRSGKEEEEEEVERELESCFLDVLVCELLSDLLTG